MIRLPRDMSRDDVSQWLNGGVYLVRTRGGDPIPCLWMGMEGTNVVGSNILTGDIVRAPHTQCFAHWPELGSFNVPGRGYAVHMSRIVERQYRRTFNKRCVHSVVPWGYPVSKALGLGVHLLGGWDTVMALPWTSTYPADIDGAERMISDGHRTVAVNRRLIIAGTPELDKRLLYLDGQLAATVQGGMLHPTCDDSDLATLVKLTGGRYYGA